MGFEWLDDKMVSMVVVVVVVVLDHTQNDVDNILLEMEEQQYEENFPLNQQIVAYDLKVYLVHAFVINVLNKNHVVGILFDIDQHHINDAIVYH